MNDQFDVPWEAGLVSDLTPGDWFVGSTTGAYPVFEVIKTGRDYYIELDGRQRPQVRVTFKCIGRGSDVMHFSTGETYSELYEPNGTTFRYNPTPVSEETVSESRKALQALV